MNSTLPSLDDPDRPAASGVSGWVRLQNLFANPPQAYGPVPFWWWGGDPLERGRLAWQLDRLKEKGILRAIVSYHHHADGSPDKGDPEVFSPAWWEMFRWLVGECKARGMQIGFQDYALLGPMLREIGRDNPGMKGAQLREKHLRVSGPADVELDLGPDTGEVLTARACPGAADRAEACGEIDLAGRVAGGKLRWSAPAGDWIVSVVSATPTDFDPLHPQAGRQVIARLYAPFETQCPGEVGRTISVFFQDELDFGARMPLWSDRVAGEFRRRKGYDLGPLLPMLWHDLGPQSPKVRIDYSDVVTTLLEENYFIPVFQWHEARGTLLANDNCGRGGIETGRAHYGDYFRTMRWYSGPGTDDPNLNEARAFKGLKVNSSIAHLYGRARVWNECFHSSGWGTTPARVIAALNEDFVYGATVVNLHGLYYSTHGSWWEWAPPDFHFRQPYWNHLGKFSDYVTRMCWVLSRGQHVCDVAILYPITALEGGLNPPGNGGSQAELPLSERQKGSRAPAEDPAESHAFGLGKFLADDGIDFDFIDFESVERAEIREGRLCVSGERYRVLVLPMMSSVRFSTLRKARDFMAAGGLVIAFGCLPAASERAGAQDTEVDQLVRELFDPASGGRGLFIQRDYAKVEDAIDGAFTRDFLPEGGRLRVLHRRTDDAEIYYVFNLSPEKIETEVFFRAHGEPQEWNAWTGAIQALERVRENNLGTKLKVELGPAEGRLIVFGRSPAPEAPKPLKLPIRFREVPLEGPWEFALIPTMDNRFGDYRLPPGAEWIGAEARRFRYAEEAGDTTGWEAPGFADANWPLITYSYGPRFWKLGPVPSDAATRNLEERLAALTKVDPAMPIVIDGKEYRWTPYEFSLRWGVENDPFLKDWASGPHGLKKQVPDEFIDLEGDSPGSAWFLWTGVQSAEKKPARLIMGSRSVYAAWLNGARALEQTAELPPGRHPAWNLPHYEAFPREARVALNAGTNPLLLRFEQPKGQRVRAYAAFDPPPANGELALRWFASGSVPVFNYRPEAERHAGWYRFVAPPGLARLRVVARGKLRVWADGVELTVQVLRPYQWLSDATVFEMAMPRPSSVGAVIALRIEQAPDSFGGDSLPERVMLECAPALAPLGDWCEMGLETYSGKGRYRRTFGLDASQAAGLVLLDLGEVAATAAVTVNGQAAGTLLAPPWRVNLSGLVRAGENELEIRVANTLANHYSVGIPTPYVFPGQTRSGLLGPVRLLLSPT